MRSGGWRTPDAWSDFLWHRTIGIVGFGRIGRAVARRLQGWDVEILVFDPYADVQEVGVRQTDLKELLTMSDVVTLHAVATDQNTHMIDASALSLMKDTAVLINSARGALVDMDALFDALSSGRLAGAALDAYDSEPPNIGHPIFALPNVIATPHASAWVKETFQRISQVGAENVWACMSGMRPEYAVNLDVLTRGKL